jgi:hypothetical protein
MLITFQINREASLGLAHQINIDAIPKDSIDDDHRYPASQSLISGAGLGTVISQALWANANNAASEKKQAMVYLRFIFLIERKSASTTTSEGERRSQG